MIKKYYINSKHFDEIPDNVSCIGKFDGVHIGHQALIKKTIELAKKHNVLPFVITFDPDPEIIIGNKKTIQLTSLNERMKLFEKFGIKGVIVIEFNNELMNMSNQDFVNTYLKKFNIKELVCGFDFHYGYMGKGNIKSLKKDLKGYCNVDVLKEVTYYSKKISSTRIINEYIKGNFNLVNKLLGYEYKR